MIISENLKIQIENLNLSKIQTKNCFKFISIILKESVKSKSDYYYFNSIFFSKTFNSYYHKFLKPLITANIIQVYTNPETNKQSYCNNTNTPKNSYSKSYRINPSLLNGESVSIPSPSDTSNQLTIPEQQEIISLLNLLEIDTASAKSIIQNKVNAVSSNSFLINSDTDINHFEINDIHKKIKKDFQHKTKSQAFKYAARNDRKIIKYKKKFYYANSLEDFISHKKEQLNNSYGTALEAFIQKDFYAKRNITNNRIDTNMTSLPAEFRDLISIKNQRLLSLDLKNSQMVIFASMLKSNHFNTELEDSTLNFIKLAETGLLYDDIATKFSSERKIVKTKIFEIIFSSEKNNTPFKKFLKTLFPQVIKIIDDFKKTNGYKEFSILLQKKESEIFIDNIYKAAVEAGITCYTIHDSILFLQEDLNKINIIVESVKKKYHIIGEFKMESKSIEEENSDNKTNQSDNKTNQKEDFEKLKSEAGMDFLFTPIPNRKIEPDIAKIIKENKTINSQDNSDIEYLDAKIIKENKTSIQDNSDIEEIINNENDMRKRKITYDVFQTSNDDIISDEEIYIVPQDIIDRDKSKSKAKLINPVMHPVMHPVIHVKAKDTDTKYFMVLKNIPHKKDNNFDYVFEMEFKKQIQEALSPFKEFLNIAIVELDSIYFAPKKVNYFELQKKADEEKKNNMTKDIAAKYSSKIEESIAKTLAIEEKNRLDMIDWDNNYFDETKFFIR